MDTDHFVCVHPANRRQHYNVMSSLIGWAHTQTAPSPWGRSSLTKSSPNRHTQGLYQLLSSGTKWTPFCLQHFKYIFVNENLYILRNISLKFVPQGQINNIPPLFQIIALWQAIISMNADPDHGTHKCSTFGDMSWPCSTWQQCPWRPQGGILITPIASLVQAIPRDPYYTIIHI